MSEVKPVQLQAITEMPTSPEQLREFIASAMRDILAIPENQLIQAKTLIDTIKKSLDESTTRAERNWLRPVVTSTYYRGAFRAVVGQYDADGDITPVSFLQEKKDAEGKIVFEDAEVNGVGLKRPVWESIEGVVNPASLALLSKLVLSQPTVPGQVFYVTTNGAIEQQMEAATDFFIAQQQSGQQLANATTEELLQSEGGQALAEATKH